MLHAGARNTWTGFQRSYGTGTRVVSDDGERSAMYVVEKGSIGIYRSGTDGRRTLISIAGPGQVFGDLRKAGLSMKRMRAIAIENSTVSIVDERSYDELVRQRPEFLQTVLSTAARNAEYLVCRLEESVNETVRVRIARALLEQNVGGKANLTHDIIGQVTGTSRQTVSLELKLLENEGVLALRRGHVNISDPDRLSQIARAEASCSTE